MRRKNGRLHHISAGVGVWAPKVKILPNLKKTKFQTINANQLRIPCTIVTNFLGPVKSFVLDQLLKLGEISVPCGFKLD